ncbi:AAA family ATPase [Alicyclobacillus acidoterrestris]|uniref:AAA family ATPase n=1 Tax=Alicyclobacillus acidoterrestris TaxID=1450 RepID=UPI0003858E7B|nr:hypothetical protein N007_21445 [Alicyclobacillus acidoterrestris ATCC 49025]
MLKLLKWWWLFIKNIIVLIGPEGTGKTTIGKLLASHFNVNQYTLDRHRDELYNEMGYDAIHAKNLFADGGIWALYSYWKPFEAFSVKSIKRT